jgi:hypothetical protein
MPDLELEKQKTKQNKSGKYKGTPTKRNLKQRLTFLAKGLKGKPRKKVLKSQAPVTHTCNP